MCWVYEQVITATDGELATQEATLNQAVYALFGLDAEEVMLLEHSLC